MKKRIEYYANSHTPLALQFMTPHEWSNSDPHNLLHVAFLKHSWWIRLPVIMKPKIDLVKLNSPSVSGRTHYEDYTQRSYGFTFTDDALHITYGIQPGCWMSDDPKNSDHTKVFWYPWDWKHIEHRTYVLEGKRIRIEDRDRYELMRDFDGGMKDMFKDFIYTDYDGTKVRARAMLEEREWWRGQGKLKYLGRLLGFRKVHRSLDLSFEQGIGQRKSSWKGGTTGAGLILSPGETVDEGVARLCRDGLK